MAPNYINSLNYSDSKMSPPPQCQKYVCRNFAFVVILTCISNF